MKVIKRDGSTVDFDRSKIVVAIQKANNAVDESERIAEDRIENIAHYVESRNRMRLLVEDIQDMVEHQLMQEGKFDLAKAYIIYRYTRALVRKANTTDESILSLIRNSNKDVMEENSNKNAVMASTQRDLIAGAFAMKVNASYACLEILMYFCTSCTFAELIVLKELSCPSIVPC